MTDEQTLIYNEITRAVERGEVVYSSYMDRVGLESIHVEDLMHMSKIKG